MAELKRPYPFPPAVCGRVRHRRRNQPAARLHRRPRLPIIGADRQTRQWPGPLPVDGIRMSPAPARRSPIRDRANSMPDAVARCPAAA